METGAMNAGAPQQGLHLMAKPVGALCNLDCGYCFYLEKTQYYPRQERFRMSDEVLEAYVRRYIAAQTGPEIEFSWQGGEPTLMGLAFFERAVALQKRYADARPIRNTLQTNGTLIDDQWAAFLAREQFLVGLSLDGPRALHDAARPDKKGRPSFDAVQRGMQALQRHGVDFNVLVTVSSANVSEPLAVYRFLRDSGVRFIQFNPVVERVADRVAREQESVVQLHFAKPPAWPLPSAPSLPQSVEVTPQSVEALAYGRFLASLFDEWVRHDVGRVHVMNFEWSLAAWCGVAPGACIFSPRCGKAAIVEHDGDVYSCDHYMYPEYKLGNVCTDDPASLIDSAAQRAFGAAKETSLPAECRRCEWRFACHGECPKNRFIRSSDGEAGMNYLCAGYKHYFSHIAPAMATMARLVREGRDAAEVMLR